MIMLYRPLDMRHKIITTVAIFLELLVSLIERGHRCDAAVRNRWLASSPSFSCQDFLGVCSVALIVRERQ
jgi:hypothetical protein